MLSAQQEGLLEGLLVLSSSGPRLGGSDAFQNC